MRSLSGVEVGVDGPLRSLDKSTTIFACSGNITAGNPSRPTLAFLHHHNRTGGAVWGICTGAVASAEAGLLDRRVFTLRWECHASFAELFPHLLPSKRRLEIDGRIMTCGGGAAAADMAITIIRKDHGDAFAAIVADMCLLRDDAGGNLAQRTSIGSVLRTRRPALIEIAAAGDFNTKSHFSKVFTRRFGIPPSRVHHHRRQQLRSH